MMQSIKHCLANLANFSGRDRPRLFWPYAGLLLLLWMLAPIPLIVNEIIAMFARINRFIAENPDKVTVIDEPGQRGTYIDGFHPELMPDVAGLMIGIGVITLLLVLLLAAAVTRRLHDIGKSGRWGLLPVPFLIGGFALFPVLYANFPTSEDLTQFLSYFIWFGVLMLNNLVYLGCLIFLVVQLASNGHHEDNRFGPNPY